MSLTSGTRIGGYEIHSALYLVAHFHDQARRWGTTGLGSAVAATLFVASLSETTGNIWMTTIGPSTEAK